MKYEAFVTCQRLHKAGDQPGRRDLIKYERHAVETTEVSYYNRSTKQFSSKAYSGPPLVKFKIKPQIDLQITSYLLKQSSTPFKRRQQNPDPQQVNKV